MTQATACSEGNLPSAVLGLAERKPVGGAAAGGEDVLDVRALHAVLLEDIQRRRAPGQSARRGRPVGRRPSLLRIEDRLDGALHQLAVLLAEADTGRVEGVNQSF